MTATTASVSPVVLPRSNGQYTHTAYTHAPQSTPPNRPDIALPNVTGVLSFPRFAPAIYQFTRLSGVG
jgi:hypothetical protein